MTQASFDAPTPDAGNVDSKRSGRYKYDVRTQRLGLYKTDTTPANTTPQYAELPPPAANQVRFLWPATVPLPGQDSERPSFAPAVQQAREAAWPATLQLSGQVASNDTEPHERAGGLGHLLSTISIGRVLIALGGIAFAVGLAFFFAYALKTSEGDYYAPTHSELPQSVPAQATPAPANPTPSPERAPATPSEPDVVPVPKESQPADAPKESQPAAHADNAAVPAGRSAALTREAASSPARRARTAAPTSRVPWWE